MTATTAAEAAARVASGTQVPMLLGALLPNDEVDFSTQDLIHWIRAAESAGLHHVVLADHVLGADPTATPEWGTQWSGTSNVGPYTTADVFREPFVLMGYLAALCTLELMTGILILPQRQTALVAKQAAEIDRLTQGRTRLGVGVGWNPVEFEALGRPFHRRGALIEEQVALLRQFWTQDVVRFSGEFHSIPPSGIQRLPVQRPIPIWMGGEAPKVLERIGRCADGWFLFSKVRPGAEFAESLAVVRRSAVEAGRDPDSIGTEPRLVIGDRSDAAIRADVRAWRDLGATHLCLDTRFGGRDPRAHADALARFTDLVRSVG
ncbi:TIGR03619 family F420-dependent LLM class oxidoreductase [Nakamurella sp. YIM 132087]|uniref:TIGR03619 family F420-dependent LLM class oxidoreductase n=1 Tax=Nakamurella alba TaxID=2665158 RepID=A0A7K1FEN1_9ACTN|nr:LLM class F420-dependent oxidoreductase [Nakamurella alba]MTD12558.1 TIGR03619 family F420-dependent LLM class oxidoreductase [Nakamurella alba]